MFLEAIRTNHLHFGSQNNVQQRGTGNSRLKKSTNWIYLGFEWRNTKKLSDFDKWKTSYDKLKEFFTTHGHSSATKPNSTTQIATWVIQQRFQKKKGTSKT
jgi:hypothetical protein